MKPHEHHRAAAGGPLGFGIVTVSDSRTTETDEGGAVAADLIEAASHRVASRVIVPDDVEDVQDALRRALASVSVDVVVLTGGTGVGPRDVTPEAVVPLLEKALPGFGELFRVLSFEEVGAAAYLSRAFAGVVGGKPVFGLPGSPAGVRLALERLILPEAAHLRRLART